MKHSFFCRLLLLLLTCCLLVSLAGCALRNVVRSKKTESDASDETSDASAEPSSDSSSVLVDPADETTVEKLTDAQKEMLSALLAQLEQELTSRLGELGVDLDIDEQTCEITLPAAILFPGDSSELSQEGKDFLARYVTIYNDVILNNVYEDYIGYILIEGHTAPLAGSTHESGMPLSTARANAVRDFCLSEEAGTSAENRELLQYVLVAMGSSNDRPVKRADGTVDMAASRRVTFRVLFVIPQEP